MGFSPPTPPFHQPNPTQTSQSANPIISAVFRRHRFVGTRRRVTAQVRLSDLSDLSDWWAEAHPTSTLQPTFPRHSRAGGNPDPSARKLIFSSSHHSYQSNQTNPTIPPFPPTTHFSASFPRRRESRFVEFQPFLINSCNFEFLDSHFCGNDGIRVSVTPPAPPIPLPKSQSDKKRQPETDKKCHT